MMDDGTERASGGKRNLVSNLDVTGIRILCAFSFIVGGIIISYYSFWPFILGFSVNIFKQQEIFRWIGIFCSGLILLFGGINLLRNNSYYYNFYFRYKDSLENKWTLLGYFARPIIAWADANNDKALGGLVMAISLYIITAVIWLTINVIMTILCYFTNFVNALQITFMITLVIIGYFYTRSHFRRLRPGEIELYPLLPDDPIIGRWHSPDGEIKMIVESNGALTINLKPSDGRQDTYFGGVVRRNLECCYWVCPRVHGSSKRAAQPYQVPPAEFAIEDGRLRDLSNDAVLLRDNSITDYTGFGY